MTLGCFANPFFAPRNRAAKVLLTYLLPLIPLAGLFDFFMSACRVYQPAELEQFASDLPQADYSWSHGHVRYSMGAEATFFFGVPS